MTTPCATGFAAQLDAMRARIAAGMPRRGWKVGINVPEIQAKLGLKHSLVGWIDGDKVLRSGAKLPILPGSLFHVEPELCLRLEESVDAGADLAMARATVDAVAPALEIVDYAKLAKTLTDIVLLVASVLRELGERLLPGDLILSGSFTVRALPLSASQTAVTTLGDLGVVRCTACA